MRMRALGALLTAATAAALAGTTVPATAQIKTGHIVGAGLPGAVPGRYVVTLQPGTTIAASSDAQVLKRSGDTYPARMTAAEAARLAANPHVQYVEQDRLVHIVSTQRNPDWGLDRIDQRSAKRSKSYTPMDDGSAVHAYVIDTGIRITHTEFAGRASYGYDEVGEDPDADDCNGHGTHVAGTIGGTHYGVAKKVELVAVRVLDCDGDGYISDVIAGVNWVTANAQKPAVANLSLGGDRSASLDAAIQKSINSGVTYVVAAGNDDRNAATDSPANLAAAITVGAVDSKGARASFSNYGKVLDMFAPGVNIRSSVASSDTATAVYSGTSMAAPHVAGAAAMVLDAYPSLTPAQVVHYLVAKATTGKVTDPHGSPNRMLYTPQPIPATSITTTKVTASLGTAYSGRLALATSRRGTWSVAGGSLPAGLSLSPGGVVSGTPAKPGTFAVTVRFVDFVPNTITRAVTVTVKKTSPVISTSSLPAASAGTTYGQQLAVADGRDGTWSLTDGSLPAGLTLDATGLISGTPVTSGDSGAFTVSFTDQWGGTASASYTLTVG